MIISFQRAGSTGEVDQEIQDLQRNKQDKLTAGAGITITTGNVISCSIDTNIFKPVAELPEQPASGDENKIFLVPASTTGASNTYDEYIWVNNDWEKVGSAQVEVDLSAYWTSAQTQQAITAATQNFVTSGDVEDAITAATNDMATETWVGNQGYITGYTPSTATTNDFGVVKVGSGITVTNGVISANIPQPADLTILEPVEDFPASAETGSLVAKCKKEISIGSWETLGNYVHRFTQTSFPTTGESSYNVVLAGGMNDGTYTYELVARFLQVGGMWTFKLHRSDGPYPQLSDGETNYLDLTDGKKMVITPDFTNHILEICEIDSNSTNIPFEGWFGGDLVIDGTYQYNGTDWVASTDLSNYYTSAQTDQAISNATSGFTTSGDVASQINTAMASETARTESTYLKEHQTLPTATTSQYGMVKVGSGISVVDGVISVTGSTPTPTGETIVNKVYPLPNQENNMGPVGTMYPRIEVDGVWGVELDQYNSAEFRLSTTDDGSEKEILSFYAYTNTAGTGVWTHQRAVSTDTDSVPRLVILDDNDTTLYEFTAFTASEYIVKGNGMFHITLAYENWQNVYRVWTENQSGEKIAEYGLNYDFIKSGDGIIQYVGKDSYGGLIYEKVGATLYARADFPKFAKPGDVIMYNTKIGYWEPELIEDEYTRVFYFTGDADSNPYGVNEFTIADYYIDDEYNIGHVKLIWDTEEETWYYHADGCEGKPYADDRDEDGPYDINYYDDGIIGDYSKMTIDSMPNECDYNDCEAPYIMTLGASYDEEYDEGAGRELPIPLDVVCSNPDSISAFMQYDGENWNKIGEPDLSNYYTSAQTNAAITAATQNFVTSGDVQSQITAATTNFVTSGDVNNQITAATQNFVTSGDVATQISGATSNFVDSTDIAHIVKCTQSQYDTMSQGGTLDSSTLYLING